MHTNKSIIFLKCETEKECDQTCHMKKHYRFFQNALIIFRRFGPQKNIMKTREFLTKGFLTRNTNDCVWFRNINIIYNFGRRFLDNLSDEKG